MNADDKEAQPTGLRRLVKAAAFGVASIAGFLVAEAIVIAGLYAFFGGLDVSRGTSGSPSLLALDVFALMVGVTASFLLNERTSVGNLGGGGQGRRATASRLGKFQLVSALGNAVVIVVQLALLTFLGVSPAIGNVVGGISAFPVSYMISIRVVWNS